MMYYSEHRDYPGAKEEFLKNYRPSAGMMFSEGIGAGFRDVSFMLMQSVMEMDKAENQPLLTKEDWKRARSTIHRLNGTTASRLQKRDY